MQNGPDVPSDLPATWMPRLGSDLAELVAAATDLTRLVGTPAHVDDFAHDLTHVAAGGSEP